MDKKTKIRLMTGVMAVTMATSIAFINPQTAYAETNTKYTQRTFIEEPMEYEESQYNRYVVKKGDNISLISQKICKYYGEEMTTKYWPVLAFLNGFPRIIQPGDIIIFPGTFEDMDSLLNSLKETGWTARYIQKNDVYGKRKKQVTHTVGSLLAEIYGEQVCVDPDFVALYLNAQGLNGKYNIDSPVDTTDMLFNLTEWIPTLQELEEFSLEQNTRRR